MIRMHNLERSRAAAIAAAVLAVAGLSGCSDTVKQSLGLGKAPPDEYRVVEQAPLALPPDFHLRPPAPGTPRPQEQDVREQAQEILLGPNSVAARSEAAQRSPGELAFLIIAGATEADPGIRQTINRESGVLAAEDDGFVDKVLFWQNPEPEGIAIDPVAEAARLRENIEAGRPVTFGETPVIVRKEKAPLEDLNIF